MENIPKKINGIFYKQGPHSLALKDINGDWITSTLRNAALARLVRANGSKMVKGKSSAFTYLQAKKMHEEIASGLESQASTARKRGVQPRTVATAINLFKNSGPDGFNFYGDEETVYKNSRGSKTCNKITYAQALQASLLRDEAVSFAKIGEILLCSESTIRNAFYCLQNFGKKGFPNAE